jgi:hypothetical protein
MAFTCGFAWWAGYLLGITAGVSAAPRDVEQWGTAQNVA